MDEPRDVELGARLDGLEVREHGADYWRAVLAAAEPELEALRGAGEVPSAPTPVVRARRRLFAGRRWLLIPSACAVAAAAAVVLLFGLPARDTTGSHPIGFGGPPPASAAEAIRYTLGALDDAQGLEGTLFIGKVRDGAFEAGDEVTFLCARDGSYRITTKALDETVAFTGLSDYVETIAYDAGSRVAQGVFDYGEQGFRSEVTTEDPGTGEDVTTTTVARYVFSEQPDVAPGPPDAGLYGTGSFPLWQVRAYLRTMLGDPGVELTTGELDGREVWFLHTRAFTDGSAGDPAIGRPVTIAIDAKTRMPLRMTGFRGDYEVRMGSAALTQAPATSEFTLEKPPADETLDQSRQGGLEVFDQFMRFPGLPFSDPAGMDKAVDDVPAFPSWLPDGFTLGIGASQTNGSVSLPSALGGGALPGTIVSLAFRRGFDTAYVSARPDPRLSHKTLIGLPGEETPHIRTDTSNPFVGDVAPWDRAQWRLHTTEVTLTAGAFRGATAHIVVDPGYWPHLWVEKGGWVATVAGDLTRAQMVRVAESLAAWGANAKQ
jgi:hypothetical protein